MTPLERLAAALADLEAQGVLTPCQHGAGALWLSDDHVERREAAALCKACPVIDECGDAAVVAGLSGGPATFGVWAGRDRTKQPGKKNPTPRKGERMTTDDSRPTIPHAARCDRRSAPILRSSWRGAPEMWCGGCGRTAPAPDTRNDKENR